MIRSGQAVDGLLPLAKAGHADALGQLLELYRNYLELLARLQIGRRLQSKVDAADLVQETFLDAHASFAEFRGATERELVAWLRRVLAFNLASLVRRYRGTRRRDVALEQELAGELDESSHALDHGFVAATSSPSQQAVRREQAVLAGRRPRPPAGRLPRGHHPAPAGRAELPRGRPAHEPLAGERQEALGPRPGAAARLPGR